ncbi:helix-turn-helix domain-containing protein [Cellvibrio sp. ARAG 10.3]|uniref:helix-turn-helix domain-containing protein n=1 Tax=Cellvibrio sp. ARAG 10.3 TaxID=3451358 RepID=UPI003F446F05
MAQVDALVETLKSALKSHNLKYRDVAQAMELSEASIKRLFSSRTFSLQQIQQVCLMMGMEISDLVQLMVERQARLQELSEEQEEEIVRDPGFLIITVCVLNRWTLEDMLRHYTFTEHECVQKLARLDRLKIIELLPKNRIKLLVAPNFSWRKNGPIQRFFLDTIEKELFQAQFDKPDHRLVVLNGMLSAQSNGELQKKIERLAREFDQLNNADAGLALPERQGYTLVLALRNWQYEQLFKYRRM